MGTRATFFVGDPRELEAREYLGSISWDGYPDGLDGFPTDRSITDEGEFRALVTALSAARDDWWPASETFAFPWTGDLFLTDYTYAFFGGRLQVSCFHRGFRDWPKDPGSDEDGPEDPSTRGVPAPGGAWRGLGRDDSVLVFTRSAEGGAS